MAPISKISFRPATICGVHQKDTDLHNSTFLVVGIGASAGGLDAFHSFFDGLPAESKSMLAEILRILPYREPDHTVSGVSITFVGPGQRVCRGAPTFIDDRRTAHGSRMTGGLAGSATPRRVLIADDNQEGAESLGMVLDLSTRSVVIVPRRCPSF